MSVKELQRNCPVCKSSIGIVIHNQSFVSVKDSPLPRNYDIVYCTHCGFVFANTSASQDDYNTYDSVFSKYEDPNISSGSAFNQNDYNRLVRTAETIEKHVKKKLNSRFRMRKWRLTFNSKKRGFTDLIGIDPSKVCVANVNAAGIEAFQTHLFERSFIKWGKKFNLIILSHVLEHIYDLEKSIRIVKSKLTEKGILYIEVPDASRYSDFFIVPYYYIDCEHINHFSKKSLNNLIQQFGFECIETYQGQVDLNDHIDYPFFTHYLSKQINFKQR